MVAVTEKWGYLLPFCPHPKCGFFKKPSHFIIQLTKCSVGERFVGVHLEIFCWHHPKTLNLVTLFLRNISPLQPHQIIPVVLACQKCFDSSNFPQFLEKTTENPLRHCELENPKISRCCFPTHQACKKCWHKGNLLNKQTWYNGMTWTFPVSGIFFHVLVL